MVNFNLSNLISAKIEYIVSFHKFFSTKLFFFTEPDCNACISEFDDDGGCTCMENPSCNPEGLIPEGCYQCGEKAMEFCRSGNFLK